MGLGLGFGFLHRSIAGEVGVALQGMLGQGSAAQSGFRPRSRESPMRCVVVLREALWTSTTWSWTNGQNLATA